MEILQVFIDILELGFNGINNFIKMLRKITK